MVKIKTIKKLASSFLCASAVLLLQAVAADAVCKNTPLNPITDVAWQGVFPIRIAGITIIKGSEPTPPDMTRKTVCLCGKTIGFVSSFWEPSRMSEVVKDPYCFVGLGAALSNPKQGFLGGTHSEQTHGSPDTSTFAQAHWYVFGVWHMLDLFYDFPCLDAEEFDLAYMTEIDPLWNDDILGFIINPESLLFGSPVAQLACIADSVAANLGYPINALFWCMGSWGSAYPLTGHMNNEAYTEASAAEAARMVFKLSREGLVWDTGINECGKVWTPIWVKENYRLQASKPVKMQSTIPIGRSSIFWGALKNPPYSASGNAGDNFMWVLFRKRLCCAGYTF